MRKWAGSAPCRLAITRDQRAGDITAVAEGKLAASCGWVRKSASAR